MKIPWAPLIDPLTSPVVTRKSILLVEISLTVISAVTDLLINIPSNTAGISIEGY